MLCFLGENGLYEEFFDVRFFLKDLMDNVDP